MSIKTRQSKTKKSSEKKRENIHAAETLNQLRMQDLRSLGKAKHSVFILIDGKKYEIIKSEQQQFLDALVDTADLLSAQKGSNILSTQEVADLLNVSRPYVVKLVDNNEIPSFKVGNQRRVRELDVLEYRKKMRNQQSRALDELAKETEKLGIKFK